MLKKWMYSLFIVIVVVAFGYLLPNLFKPSLDTKSCAFCEISIVSRQKFYEDDFVIALYTHKPVVEAHFLIIPKRHIERFEMLSDEEVVQINQVIKKVHQASKETFGTESYLLLQKNGVEVGQTVPHVHIHYMGRKLGEDSTVKFMIKMLVAPLLGPISLDQMAFLTKTMQSAMQEDSYLEKRFSLN